MIRRLIVMRHAKSSWSSGAASDHERPLNPRGIQDAPRVAAELVKREWEPRMILSSDSKRTRETFAGMASQFSEDIEVQFWRELYCSDMDDVVPFVSQVSTEMSPVMVLGHNPGWEYVVNHLTRERVVMKTATAALLEIESPDWNQAIRSSGEWNLVDVVYPREID